MSPASQASSARRRIRESQAPPTPTTQQANIVKGFKEAWEAKDIDALVGLLDPEATAIADSGGLAAARLRPIEGSEQIARVYIDLVRKAAIKRVWAVRNPEKLRAWTTGTC